MVLTGGVQVVIAPWRGEGPPDWEFYQTHPEYVARANKWNRGILADRCLPGNFAVLVFCAMLLTA